MLDLGNELLGRRHGGDGELRPDEFWAVKDVSFELKRGECLGLIGRNGAGKTTLLRMLNGLIKPDAGRIEMRGRVGALIALGAGFNPILTGRENIYVNATVLGLSKCEINKKLEQIIAFANLEEFIDTPVQYYSSGMYVRLGFSVAANINPDVLLVDEALAVGDLAFIIKCLNKAAALRREGTAIIFVSHNELQVREAAGRCLVMSKGRLVGDADLDQAFFLYNKHCEMGKYQNQSKTGFVHNGPVRMGKCRIIPTAQKEIASSADPLQILIQYESAIPVSNASLELRIWNIHEQIVTSISSIGQNLPIEIYPGANTITVDIPSLALVPGHYRLAGGFRKDGEFLGWAYDLAYFDISPPSDFKVSEGFFVTPAKIKASQAY